MKQDNDFIDTFFRQRFFKVKGEEYKFVFSLKVARLIPRMSICEKFTTEFFKEVAKLDLKDGHYAVFVNNQNGTKTLYRFSFDKKKKLYFITKISLNRKIVNVVENHNTILLKKSGQELYQQKLNTKHQVVTLNKTPTRKRKQNYGTGFRIIKKGINNV